VLYDECVVHYDATEAPLMKILGYVYLYVTCTADEYADIEEKEAALSLIAQ